MTELFIRLFNISISASFFVLAILAFRLIFKKAPKFISVLLFGLVGLRLILPFSIESSLSLVPSKSTLPDGIELERYPMIESGIPQLNEAVNPYFENSFAPTPEMSANPLQILFGALSYVWVAVAAAMILYLVFSYVVLRLRLRESVLLEGRVYLSDYAKTPFILGIIKPKIYVPSNASQDALPLILAHEKAHISRLDHLWKPLAFILLSVYWFNPILWIAYYMLCRDIELACDERVMKNYTDAQKASYSEALLKFSSDKALHGACPLAFGEVGVKARIMRIKNYTKPTLILLVLSIAVTVILGACFLTDKVSENTKPTAGIYYAESVLYTNGTSDKSAEGVPLFIFFDDGRVLVESKGLEYSTFGELGLMHKCYLSNDGYRSLFSGSNFGIDYIKGRNNAVYRAEPPKSFADIECDEVYIFVQDSEEILLGYAYGADKNAKIGELYSLRTDEALPTNYMTATYTQAGELDDDGWRMSFSINPADNSMSLSFGAWSSYFGTGTYEISESRLILKTNDGRYTLVFDISGKNPKYAKNESTELHLEDGSEFERTYEFSAVPASVFYDVGSDGRYEYVHLSKTETDSEFALRFDVFARGDRIEPITVPFKKYDYVELVKNEADNTLTLKCHNRDLISGTQYYDIQINYDSAIINPK